MSATWITSATSIAVIVIIVLTWAWKVLNWLWLKPKKLERLLREQGLKGNPYRILVGDVSDMLKMRKEAKYKPMTLSHDIIPRVLPFVYQSVIKHGKNSFIWFGPVPRLTITDPQLIKDVYNNIHSFQKVSINPPLSLLVTGLIMLPAISESCSDMMSKWEDMLSSDGSCELDVLPFLRNLTSDVISRTAFGHNHEEGRRIFELQKEQAELLMKVILKLNIPGWRFLPTRTHKRIKEIDTDIQASLKGIIMKREKAGEATKNDLLGILLESNNMEVKEHGNEKNVGMTLQDVIEECKLFYFAGQETTSNLLVWTMILLSNYSDWQALARKEVLQVFGNQKPYFDGLSHLKIVTMILYEVLRLYPPAIASSRAVHKDMKLGNMTLPAGVQILLPTVLVHHDSELWGHDAKEFKPERFSEGVSKATNGQVSFFPFGWGPRICIGQNFAMLEAKMALSIILQHFAFELSTAYTHAPTTVLTLQPQHGAHIILHKL
ncbi:hypothetical protein Lal_00029328 [Lupinus albus]|nr:hypothetical protein Lal_00029328 [Lupinus albus]